MLLQVDKTWMIHSIFHFPIVIFQIQVSVWKVYAPDDRWKVGVFPLLEAGILTTVYIPFIRSFGQLTVLASEVTPLLEELLFPLTD